MNRNTAILIFANSAAREKNRKFFFKSEVLFDALNEQTIKKAKQTGLPYFLISENEQTGSTFAERYTVALKTIFEKGFEHVISIGNDTPQLRSQHIVVAAKALQNKKAVIGPSKDGGFYLLGIDKSFFNENVFLQFPWQEATLFGAISKALTKNNISTLQLETLQDIDTVADITWLKDAFHITKSVRLLLWQIVACRSAEIVYKKINSTILNTAQPYNKGSPRAA